MPVCSADTHEVVDVHHTLKLPEHAAQATITMRQSSSQSSAVLDGNADQKIYLCLRVDDTSDLDIRS